MSDKLPNWIYDVVNDLLDEEDTHAAYWIEAFSIEAGKHVMVRHNWCPAGPLALVPDEVKVAAQTIATYRRAAETP